MGEKMKVHIVIATHDFTEGRIKAVFSSNEKASKFRKDLQKEEGINSFTNVYDLDVYLKRKEVMEEIKY